MILMHNVRQDAYYCNLADYFPAGGGGGADGGTGGGGGGGGGVALGRGREFLSALVELKNLSMVVRCGIRHAVYFITK